MQCSLNYWNFRVNLLLLLLIIQLKQILFEISVTWLTPILFFFNCSFQFLYRKHCNKKFHMQNLLVILYKYLHVFYQPEDKGRFTKVKNHILCLLEYPIIPSKAVVLYMALEDETGRYFPKTFISQKRWFQI